MVDLSLQGKHILLGVSGGIAAYKSAELTRLLVKAGAQVRVVLTRGGAEFVTPLTFQALSGNPVYQHLLDEQAEAGMGHIELAKWADLVLVAPATADIMARFAAGFGDDLLTTLTLATEAPIYLAPAMNQAMWRDPRTQRNAHYLSSIGWHLLGPDSGSQACGDVGPGRMLEPQAIVAQLQSHHRRPTSQSLQGKTVWITAGPTREALDPVRFISNHSSGKMGFALAQAASEAGAQVRLISGPVSLPTPVGVERVNVESAEQMLSASLDGIQHCDIFIAAAAVADYRAAEVAEHKIKKQSGKDSLALSLIKNPDIVATVAALTPDLRPFTVGFAAETRDVIEYAQDKLARKKLDMIIANDVSAEGIGFNSDDNAVTLVRPHHVLTLPRASKHELARKLIEHLAAAYYDPATPAGETIEATDVLAVTSQ
ncbi:bifunctional phosphopantothenoylcysteine decarboxylase/phosphopantothenate--cysteine ligase CoaBC [Pokkaliibacter plantistimulans]|uniref:Coenzyme A biosynthesis bifunctional protein CoaBC n=1 Tax=Proteobacteria bacterium 228 TaxID=2083153 RepID=A0A2S5KRV3_9PROT|nr:bifunctional phosphopantothenoylcysteine decarboxylase/phosphopantothenate--cysteine ligase CoaBC [Pokkaliibacter plantistimulans]PPC77488.1 bifunctional phosphopantothenoylcysteine decarboxylase/phosphopantothenate--cysteine ligase CoaBC [Pokkaliibacter plantistimulans]